MAQFCIPRNAMKDVVKEIKSLGENPLQKLAGMKKSERIKLLGKNLPDDSAKKLNEQFEKAIMSEKIASLSSWVTKNLEPKYRDEFSEKALEKRFKNLEELDEYIEANAENFVLQKAKVALTAKEIKEFSRLGKELLTAQKSLGDNVGDIVDNFDGNLEYAKKLRDIEEYTLEISPNSKWKTFTNTIGKAVMLASIKSPLLNIISNTVQGLNEAVVRRFTNASIGGRVDKVILKNYVKNVQKIFKETGIDFTRMVALDDTVTGVGRLTGEDISVPKSKIARVATDFIFNKTLSTPDVFFSAYHSADSMNLMSTRIARGNKEKANEIFRDAIRLEPRTTEGQVVRAQAIADAQYATFTNESRTAIVNQSIRKLLNHAGGLGDIVMPFVKTPSNVVEAGLDYSGLGAIKAIYKMTQSAKSGLDSFTKERILEISRDLYRSGLGFTGAYLLSQWIKPEEFMGAYDPDRVGIDQLENKAYNAVKIGDKWVSLDYFGPIGAPLVGMLYAKKYGKSEGRLASYSKGMLEAYLRAPGFEPLYTATKEVFEASEDGGTTRAISKIPQTLVDEIASRIVPGIMYDFAKAMDDVQRDTRQKKYLLNVGIGEVNFDKLAVKLPFLRDTLKPKHDSLGQVMLEENGFSSFLFGARVRTARQNAVVDEVTRLSDSGNTPNLKDMRFMYSSKVNELKKKVGNDTFYGITKEFGEEMARKIDSEIRKDSYKRLSDEEKKDKIDSIAQEQYEKVLRGNGVKYR